ncbi:M15 family metallopeptidase [Actinoallomurus iriomotensis]|nr:M15 family metallopeptidase [Actinoallomurus iriomotensis]
MGSLTEITLMSDERVAGIPVAEIGEPFVDLRRHPELVLDGRLADPLGAYAHVRAGVATRLLEAQSLLRDGLRLRVVEAYRPPALQRRYFDEYASELACLHPEWPPSRLHAQASRFVAPPEVAPHVAGAAVDVTLCDADGAELPMGTEVNANPEESDGDCYTAAPGISAGARRNRELLSTVLTAAGMVNYPTEWWHWSYGDRYWAMRTNSPAALYRQHDVNVLPKEGDDV